MSKVMEGVWERAPIAGGDPFYRLIIEGHSEWLELKTEEQTLALRRFMRDNPRVLRSLADMAFALYNKGHRRIGMKMLWENLRYQRMLDTVGDAYKLNNNYTAAYARLLISLYPQFEGVILTRGE